MFYENYIKSNLKFKKITIPNFKMGMCSDLDDANFSFGSCKQCFNFDFSKDALTDGVGISNTISIVWRVAGQNYVKKLSMPEQLLSIKACFSFRCFNNATRTYMSYLLFYGNDFKFYYIRLDNNSLTYTQVAELSFDILPNIYLVKVNGVDKLYFYHRTIGGYIWDIDSNISTQLANPMKIKDTCIYEDRLYANFIDNESLIRFSEQLNLLSFNSASDSTGSIVLSDEYGSCQKILVFEDNLYLFKDYAIFRIVHNATNQEVRVENIFYSKNFIFPNTICVCDNKIIFLTTNGLFEFNGTTCKKIDLNINDMFDVDLNKYSVAVYNKGYYYLSCRLKYRNNYSFDCEDYSTYKNNSLIRLNISDNSVSLCSGWDFGSLTTINDTNNDLVLAVFRRKNNVEYCGLLDMSGKIEDVVTNKVWQSVISDLGESGKKKFIKDMCFVTKKDIVLELYIDNKTVRKNISGSANVQTIKINEKAEKFGFSLISNSVENYITRPTFRIGFYE